MINQRQFRAPSLQWPTEYRYPDETYTDRLALEVGGERFELFHDRGETDDATWVWSPERRILFAGDMFIWASPNCGNPQKVQRYARLGGGVPQDGRARARYPPARPRAADRRRERVHQALTEGAELLETLVEQTLSMMNDGARLDDIVHSVRPPAHLLERPYLQPIYDEPEFVVRNIWRQYGGWYDGDPSHLKPAPPAVLAEELASLAGGASKLASAARGRRGRRSASGRPSRRARGAGRAPRQGCARGAREVFGAARPRRGVDDVEGHLLVGRARVAKAEA